MRNVQDDSWEVKSNQRSQIYTISRERRYLVRAENVPCPRFGRRRVSWSVADAYQHSEVRQHTPVDGWKLHTIGTRDCPSYIAVDRRTGRFVREWETYADLCAYFRALAPREQLVF
jgi:hypothetical protein